MRGLIEKFINDIINIIYTTDNSNLEVQYSSLYSELLERLQRNKKILQQSLMKQEVGSKNRDDFAANGTLEQ